MAEVKTKMLDRIEKLIVDGQKEVLGRFAEVKTNLGNRIGALGERQKALEDGQRKLEDGLKKVHSSLKNEIRATAYALDDKIERSKEELKGEVRRVVEEHTPVSHAV